MGIFAGACHIECRNGFGVQEHVNAKKAHLYKLLLYEKVGSFFKKMHCNLEKADGML